MASEPPNPSWHPALMPDHEDPTESNKPTEGAQHTSRDSSPDLSDHGTPLDEEHRTLGGPFDVEEPSDAWLSKEDGHSHSYDHEHEHDQDFHTHGGGATLPASRGSDAPSQPAQTENTEHPPPPTGSKHASSSSFARTVSHEVSLGDDDESDWHLSRTNTDPFKFMPPSDRTNSFPPVPPVAGTEHYEESHPLPSNQAMEVLEETERDAESDGRDDAHDWSSHHHYGRDRSASQTVSGEVQGIEGQNSQARFEEGVPLISHPEHEAPAKPAKKGHKKTISRVFKDAVPDDEDDFFGQVQEQPEFSAPPPLERKSTTQVMGSLTPEVLSRQNTFNGTLKEEDEPVNTPGSTNAGAGTEDLNSKWEAALDDQDDAELLLDDNENVDPTAFLGSDDEGLLDDEEPAPLPSVSVEPQSRSVSSSNPYAPQSYTPQVPANPYAPSQAAVPSQASYFPQQTTPQPYSQTPQYGQLPVDPKVESARAQSFADKAKGGYSSPYDLPSDLVANVAKPKKRPSTQSLQGHSAAIQPPPPPPPGRSSSMYEQVPAPPTSNSGSRPSTSHSGQGAPLNPRASAPPLRNKSSFFEELPVASKPRPVSRQGAGQQLSPQSAQFQGPPHGPPSSTAPTPSVGAQMAPPPPPVVSQPPPGVGGLVAPPKVSPYANLPAVSNSVPPPSGGASRYSPSPSQSGSNGAPLTGPNSRYSPAPTTTRQASGYSPTNGPQLSHQPRTSSPLAHFELNTGKPHIAGEHGPLSERRASSSSYDHRLNRVPSLPPTREVDEDDSQDSITKPSLSPYTPSTAQGTLSPPKRINANYAPQPIEPGQNGFVPPPRAQTQSPGATRSGRPVNHQRRPSSAHGGTLPTQPNTSAQAYYAPSYSRARGASLNMEMVPPNDGQEHDPLQRWRGVPILAWGVGGTIITTFPKNIPRYSMNSSVPTVSRAPGEVKVLHAKDVDPLPDRLAKFPGPLKGKSKKKETIAWLSSGIETLEKTLPDVSFHPELSPEAKRAMERLLLWKILRVFIEHDGALEGSPAVEKAVKEVLLPQKLENAQNFSPIDAQTSLPTQMQADRVDASAMEGIKTSLVQGDRVSAVWAAVDKRLWGHAMLIANTVSPDLYKQVAQEFVRKEVNYPGHNNESMAAFYKILSGNYEDCVDELVSSHARAGFQMVSTQLGTGASNAGLDGLDKWRETLALVLSNRSTDDVKGLNELGRLLSSYGRAEAAHICFMFGRSLSHFGGIHEPGVDFVLLGSDHRQQAEQFGKETEALELSEVYEYGLSLAGGIAATSGAPHLAGYKLQHAITLAEYGYRDRALQYCEAMVAAATSQTKRSPYYSQVLVSAVDDFMTRLKQAPKEGSNSWISKPSMNKVSDSMWNKFNKFVAGDEGDNANGNTQEGEKGLFDRIATTPTLSRSPSTNNFETFANSPAPMFATLAQPTTAAASRYAPAPASAASSNPYAPASGQSQSPEYPAVTQGYPGGGPAPVATGGYAPQATLAPSQGYFPYEPGAPTPAADAHSSSMSNAGGYQPYGLQASPNIIPASASPHNEVPSNLGYLPPSYGFEPPQLTPASDNDDKNGTQSDSASGYEPPSFQPYGFEPPSTQTSYNPDSEDGAEDKAMNKKKSFMDDDDDDIPALRVQPDEKSKAEKDRENEEMFRKAAEEDGKTNQETQRMIITDRVLAKRAEAEKAGKKGWGFGGWFAKKPASPSPAPSEGSPNKPIRAKLGEASSFVYDPELKRWVNKKPGAENVEAKTATPPPPKGPGRSVTSTPPPPKSTPPPPGAARSVSGGPPAIRSVPPMGLGPSLSQPPSMETLAVPQAMSRSASQNSLGGGPPSRPPSRPTTSMSNASSIDDLIGAAGPRKAGSKKPRKSGRYVDVMAKN